MANKPLLLSDNLFDRIALHPGYVIGNSGSDDASGRDVDRVADNLRDLSSWTTTGTNSARTIYTDTLNNVAPNIIVLDRGHNLAGVTVVIKSFTDQTLVTPTTIATCTIPTTAGGTASSANGSLTPDGVWWKTFAGSSNRVQGLTVPALGSGIAPIITGLYLGTYYRFPEFMNAPGAYDYATDLKFMRNEMSRGGLRSKSRGINLDRIEIALDTESADYSGFDTEARRLFRYGQPWWYCHDDSDAAGSGLMRLFQLPGDFSYRPQVNPVHREIRIPLEEVLPTLYT